MLRDTRTTLQSPGDGDARQVQAIDVNTLLKGRREIILKFGNSQYRLQLTRNGKLILTK